MNYAYADSVIGSRLRYVSHTMLRTSEGLSVDVVQRDNQRALTVATHLTLFDSAPAMRITHTITNASENQLHLLAMSSALAGISNAADLDKLHLLWGENGWTSEGRWHDNPLSDQLLPMQDAKFGLDVSDRFALDSSGTWSTGRYLPIGAVYDPKTGQALAWQLESGGPWQWEIGRTGEGGYLALLGPTDLEHQFCVTLAPGESFQTVPAALAIADNGRDGAIAALTAYRRATRVTRPIDATFPVIYNDFMNTLVGDQSTEKLEPLITAAAEAGADCFCIDAGWSAPLGEPDWWDSVGEWVEGADRFTQGLSHSVELIRSLGMTPGLWLELEAVGVRSPVADSLPNDAFLQRCGQRVITHNRYHLDFRHPTAVGHANGVLDRLIETFRVGYIKLDYNINPGPGTDAGGSSAGAGLLGHVRAYREWLAAAQARHPEVLFENCASGGMRADYHLLSLAHLQSTSDQQDPIRYASIAAAAPVAILPEQAGNWACPTAEMDLEQTAFCLINGLAGRLYLSGLLHTLSYPQRHLVHEAVATAKQWRHKVATALPAWPIGLPAWDAPQLALALVCHDEILIAIWSRGPARRLRLKFPYPIVAPAQVFPQELPAWPMHTERTSLTVDVPAGPAARLIRCLQST